ncbi:twin-arginine translocase subunit TatC [Parvibium lacunae]|uniref:Sec-independent protein translocase protein TatC n=1 Tax=Parvibium lacunae TaxID=1888893 RepID=A0A368L4Q5_9BURK|nr:twin-arginine translocase subunit TatC [Parvibium lacunae]RCS58568.1 twin-arginine translocase subunit TatC [Parvibium lacunae]
MADSSPPPQPETPAAANGSDTFMSHLLELRNRVLWSLLAVLFVTGGLLVWPGMGAVYDFLAEPMISTLPAGTKMIATSVISPFLTPLKVTLLAGFMLALPVVLYQAWRFVAPGLYQHEKMIALPILVSATVLFYLGVAFCYFLIFKQFFVFIAKMAPQSITAAPDIEAYLDFVMSMFIAFGLAFEVPVVVIVLVLLGITTVAKLREIRGYVVIGITVIAAVVTPPDVFSQIALGLPMWLLYELGILVAVLLERQRPAAVSE